MGCVNWDDPQPHTRLIKGKVKHEPRYFVACECGAVRLLKACDARKAEKGSGLCVRCSAREKGVKGYATTKARYGAAFGAKLIQAYRLDHPSKLELQVMGHLEALGIRYEREVIVCDRWMVDFLIDGQIVIEVDGEYVHALRDPQTEAYRRNQIQQAGYALLALPEIDVPHAQPIIALFILEARHVSSSQNVYAHA